MPVYTDQQMPAGKQQSGLPYKRSISASTHSKLLLEARERKGVTIFNLSTSVMYIDFGSSVSLTDFATWIPPNGYYEMPFVTPAAMRGIWESANGKALIREFR